MVFSSPSDLIFETQSFTVERAPHPFVSREEGGHLRIFPKNLQYSCSAELNPVEAIELTRLEMVVREALIEAMNQQGVPVVWVNSMELGNWAFKRNERPALHIQIFGRAHTATIQKWPEALYLPDRSTGFYDTFAPLTDDDMRVIAQEIERLLQTDKYQDRNWFILR